jgi:AcrR family transcriptional regulator
MPATIPPLATPESTPLGRKRDQSLDATLLEATLDVLAEVGATGLTMDAVAARAGAGKATIYRRWASKTALVIDAVAHMKRNQVGLDSLPDTGTLRGDLLGLFKPQSIEEGERKLKIMSGLASLLSQDTSLADAANAAVVQPWADAHFALMHRSLGRGEISPSADIHTLSTVIPSMAAYRTLFQRVPFDFDFLVSMIDEVVLPALHCGPLAERAHSTRKIPPIIPSSIEGPPTAAPVARATSRKK